MQCHTAPRPSTHLLTQVPFVEPRSVRTREEKPPLASRRRTTSRRTWRPDTVGASTMKSQSLWEKEDESRESELGRR